MSEFLSNALQLSTNLTQSHQEFATRFGSFSQGGFQPLNVLAMIQVIRSGCLKLAFGCLKLAAERADLNGDMVTRTQYLELEFVPLVFQCLELGGESQFDGVVTSRVD